MEDVTIVQADAVISAGGIHGLARSDIPGKEHPAAKARGAGFWHCRSLASVQESRGSSRGQVFRGAETARVVWGQRVLLPWCLMWGRDGAVSFLILVFGHRYAGRLLRMLSASQVLFVSEDGSHGIDAELLS